MRIAVYLTVLVCLCLCQYPECEYNCKIDSPEKEEDSGDGRNPGITE